MNGYMTIGSQMPRRISDNPADPKDADLAELKAERETLKEFFLSDIQRNGIIDPQTARLMDFIESTASDGVFDAGREFLGWIFYNAMRGNDERVLSEVKRKLDELMDDFLEREL